MPKLTIKSGQFAGKEFELQPGLNSVGRGPENSISIPEPSVSTFHCELNLADIGLAVHDLNSTNGTFINKQPVSKGMLQTGDVLTLGDVEFTAELPEVMIAMVAEATRRRPIRVNRNAISTVANTSKRPSTHR